MDFLSEPQKRILKTLLHGKKRPTDISRELGKSKSTVVEHLEKLCRMGLVERMSEDGKKWVFYQLSRDGVSLFPKEKKRKRIIVIALSLLLIFSGVFMLFPKEDKVAMQEISPKNMEFKSAKAAEYPKKESANQFSYLALVLVGIGTSLLIYQIYSKD